ncbi:02d3c91f-25c4-436a-8875-6892e862af1f [Thermothielavioides terrestris]|uniref:02d3c91f-25c4-436a-8875-6892e862af1f n=1 Tax=Thermothielavioides terrestris TaxID=2587410 RepID=A0A3S4AKC2_9PEZI|nr:02d3c91f-25c4-436a-8875-6892e862af1f [Thermothielavioides terrestris]
MFGSRRHRPPNPPQPLTAATANPNAATAAAAVFKRHESNASLPAAAAAAALRARPTTPTRVADVQTKRTLRRSLSVASSGTASQPGPDQPALRRRGSSGSMAERTFRTPSPHRPSSSSGSGAPRSQPFADEMPPVPALPRDVGASSALRGGGIAQQDSQLRRANSVTVGSTPLRLASQKLASGEGPSWFGAAKLGDLGSVRRTDPAMASPPSSPLQLSARDEDPPEGQRPGSQASSINFSYPTRARLGSPNVAQQPKPSTVSPTSAHTNQPRPSTEDRQTAQAPRVRQQPKEQMRTQSVTSYAADQILVYDPNSRRMVPQADLLAVEQAVRNASQQRTGSKKKVRAPQGAGSHLAAGTMSRTKSEASHTAPPAKTQPPRPVAPVQLERRDQPPPAADAVPARNTRADVEEPAVKMVISSPRIEEKRLEQQHEQNAKASLRISTPGVPTSVPAAPVAARLAVRRQPSVVQEEPEPQDSEGERKAERVVSDASDAVPARQRMRRAALPENQPPAAPQQQATLPSSGFPESRATNLADQRPKEDFPDVSENRQSKPGAVALVSRERTHSSSPPRQAHFGPVQDNLTVKHSPPPRSISPRKSAMKHTSPPRGPSPSGDTSETSGSVSQDPPVSRKKSVRVSFEDGSTAGVGNESAKRTDSPSTGSPQPTHRHSWLSHLGRPHVDLPPLEVDEVMKPRPALPSFGSVRDRKPRDTSLDQTERPLVRPKADTRHSWQALPSAPLGASNDHAIGAVLSREQQVSREKHGHAEHTSTPGEPLPPVVTSVEGPAYFSDSSDSSSIISSEFEHPEVVLPTTAPGPPPEAKGGLQSAPPVNGAAASTGRDDLPSHEVKVQDKTAEPQIPTISVSQATPLGGENKSLGQSFMDVPGGFPEDESDQSAASAARKAQGPTVVQPAEATLPDSNSAQTIVHTGQHSTAQDETDSESSIYSDAYEDLSDIEGDGFQSLDAVVEGPLQASPLQQNQPRRDLPEHALPETSSLQPKQEAPALHTEISSATTAVETSPAETPQDEWERAKAYLKSLTAEKRAQLAREAMEEAGIEADMDEVEREFKVKKKKSVERRNSERKALALHMAQQMMAQQEKETATNPDRSYMIQPGEGLAGAGLDIPPMRKTMRGEAEQPTSLPAVERPRLRKSMRTSGPADGSQELRATTANRAAAKRQVSSPPVTGDPTETAGHRRSVTQVEPAAAVARPLQSTIQRRGSTGSESSFKRARPARAQGFGFRHSLRPTSPPSPRSDDNRSSKRFSLRTLSPARSSLASTSAPAPAPMRTTLRGQPPAKKSPTGIRMPSFSLSYGGGKKSSSGAGPGGSRFTSRLADSSDEDDGGFSSRFHSRFADDSSDDEPARPLPLPLPKPAAPAAPAGLPHALRKESSIASTALPEELESSDDTRDAATSLAVHPDNQGKPLLAPAANSTVTTATTTAKTDLSLRRIRSGRGTLLPTTTTTTAAAPASSLSQPATAATTAAENATTAATAGPSRRRNSLLLSVLRPRRGRQGQGGGAIARPEVSESAARRDTPLERSVGQLERIRSRGARRSLGAGAGVGAALGAGAAAATAADGDEDGEDGDNGEEGVGQGVVAVQQQRSPRLRLQKRGSRSAAVGGVNATSGSGTAAGRVSGAVVPLTQPQPRSSGLDHSGDAGLLVQQLHLTRSATSEKNLGTRTLSSGGGGGSGGGFLHLRPQPPPRVSSLGGGTADLTSVDGSVAGASSTTRKKRFGALRRMFKIED